MTEGGHRELRIFGVRFGHRVPTQLVVVQGEVLLQKLAAERTAFDGAHEASVAERQPARVLFDVEVDRRRQIDSVLGASGRAHDKTELSFSSSAGSPFTRHGAETAQGAMVQESAPRSFPASEGLVPLPRGGQHGRKIRRCNTLSHGGHDSRGFVVRE